MTIIKIFRWFIFLSSITCLADEEHQSLKGGSPLFYEKSLTQLHSPVFFGAGFLVGSWLAFKAAQRYIFASKKSRIILLRNRESDTGTRPAPKEVSSATVGSQSPGIITRKVPGTASSDQPIVDTDDPFKTINQSDKKGFKEIEKIVEIEDRTGRIIGLGEIRWQKNSITSSSAHCKDPELRLPVHFGVFEKILTK